MSSSVKQVKRLALIQAWDLHLKAVAVNLLQVGERDVSESEWGFPNLWMSVDADQLIDVS